MILSSKVSTRQSWIDFIMSIIADKRRLSNDNYFSYLAKSLSITGEIWQKGDTGCTGIDKTAWKKVRVVPRQQVHTVNLSGGRRD